MLFWRIMAPLRAIAKPRKFLARLIVRPARRRLQRVRRAARIKTSAEAR
jgi:hypothetical protein